MPFAFRIMTNLVNDSSVGVRIANAAVWESEMSEAMRG